MNKRFEKLELKNKRFGCLRVLKEFGRHGRNITWLCLCSCGVRKIIQGRFLKSGHTKSCGHLSFVKQTHGMTGNRTYRIWKGMLTRSVKYTSSEFTRSRNS